MKKNTYIKPQVHVLEVETTSTVLSASNPSYKINNFGTDAEVLTKKSGWDATQWQ